MRSKLFVPASRPELYLKAMNSAADAVSFDLEDAVKPEDRPEARRQLARFLEHQEKSQKSVIIRVNALGSQDLEADLQVAVHKNVSMINLPKVESAQDILVLVNQLEILEKNKKISPAITLLATIETPKGLRLAAEIAGASPRLAGLQLGFGDLLAPHAISTEDMATRQQIRLQLKLSAAEHQRPVWDSAWPNIRDLKAFEQDAQCAKQLGYRGKSCIHPTQIISANQIFTPSETEVQQAKAIIEAAKNSSQGASQFQGKMIDAPYLAQAIEIVKQAQQYQ